jgi:hypothetical protein
MIRLAHTGVNEAACRSQNLGKGDEGWTAGRQDERNRREQQEKQIVAAIVRADSEALDRRASLWRRRISAGARLKPARCTGKPYTPAATPEVVAATTFIAAALCIVKAIQP